MPGWADLKLWMAACWKVRWNVDPLPLSGPERLALLDEELLLAVDPLLPEDPQAATKEAIAAASPTVVRRSMRRSCISGTPILRYSPVDSSDARSTQPPAASWSACQT